MEAAARKGKPFKIGAGRKVATVSEAAAVVVVVVVSRKRLLWADSPLCDVDEAGEGGRG